MIAELLNRRAPESDTLDFKREPYGAGNKQHGELLKDVTAFANSFGGRIILGIVPDDDGRAVEACGVNVDNIDSEIERYENICRTSIQPVLTSLKISSEKYEDKAFIVIDVAPSHLAPHRIEYVSSKYHRAYYVRRGRSCAEASAHEVRDMILNQQRIPHLIDQFFNERIDRLKVGKLASGYEGLGPSMIVLAAPTVSFGTNVLVEDALKPDNGFKYGNAHTSFSAKPNIFGAYCKGDSEIEYTQLHHNGVVEFYYGNIIHNLEDNDRMVVPGLRLIQFLWHDLRKTVRAYSKIIQPQLYYVRILFNEVRYPLIQEIWDSNRTIPSESFFSLPDITMRVSDDGSINQKDIKEASDLIWRCWGRVKCPYFDAEGTPSPNVSR